MQIGAEQDNLQLLDAATSRSTERILQMRDDQFRLFGARLVSMVGHDSQRSAEAFGAEALGMIDGIYVIVLCSCSTYLSDAWQGLVQNPEQT